MVADIRHLLNTFNAAVQLPSDVLVMIPLFLPACDDLFAASQICRRWRAILVSSPLLWRRMDCRHLGKAVASLERHRSVPLRLELDSDLSTGALNMVLDSGGKISSVSAHLLPDQLRSLHPRLVTPSVEELVLFIDESEVSTWKQNINVNIQGEFMFTHKLSVSGFLLPIDRITAPNLIHLSLENTISGFSRITIQSVLKMLQGCSQLETVLINILSDGTGELQSYSPVNLPKLRSVELGRTEVWAGLVFPLRFHPGVAVGFRNIPATQVTWPRKSIRHVLGMVDIGSVTLAHIRHSEDVGYDACLIRFEGSTGSLEITVLEELGRDPFGPDGLLLSHSPRLENVKTLHVMNCHMSDNTLTAIASAMCNLVSISFIGHNECLSSLGDSPTLFPHLEHIAGLPAAEDLIWVARAREQYGMPLKALDIHDEPGHRATYLADLRKFVDDVRVWRCADLPKRWTGNALLDVWEAAGYHGPVRAECCRRNEN